MCAPLTASQAQKKVTCEIPKGAIDDEPRSGDGSVVGDDDSNQCVCLPPLPGGKDKGPKKKDKEPPLQTFGFPVADHPDAGKPDKKADKKKKEDKPPLQTFGFPVADHPDAGSGKPDKQKGGKDKKKDGKDDKKAPLKTFAHDSAFLQRPLSVSFPRGPAKSGGPITSQWKRETIRKKGSVLLQLDDTTREDQQVRAGKRQRLKRGRGSLQLVGGESLPSSVLGLGLITKYNMPAISCTGFQNQMNNGREACPPCQPTCTVGNCAPMCCPGMPDKCNDPICHQNCLDSVDPVKARINHPAGIPTTWNDGDGTQVDPTMQACPCGGGPGPPVSIVLIITAMARHCY